MSYTWDKVSEETLNAYQQVTGIKQEQAVKQIEIQRPSGTAPAEKISMGGYDLASGTVEFQETLERGEMAARNREYNLALDLLERALEMEPRSVRALRASGAVYLAENNISKAAEFFKRALEIDQHDPRALSGLGMCEMKQGSAAVAYQCYLKALDRDPYHLVTIFQLIECCYVMRSYDDLIEILKRYLEAHPEDLEMKFCLAGAYYKQKDYSKAQQLLDQVLEANPNHLGSLELQEKIHQEEVPEQSTQPSAMAEDSSVSEDDQSAIVESPAAEERSDFNNLDNQLSLLEEKKHLKEFDEVCRGCDQILASEDISAAQREQALLLLAEVSVLQGDLPSAEQAFADILGTNPESARALCGQGAIAASRSQWDVAERLFERARQIDPQYDVPLAGMGIVFSWKQNYDQAWKCYQEALERNPENSRALLGLLEIGYPLQRFAEVEQAIKTYLDMHPGDLDFVYSLAGCYFAQNRLEEAKEEVDKITLFDPAHEKALELRELIQERLG